VTLLPPEIRCVLFDAVGTLIFPHPPVAAAYGAVARRHGSSLGEEEIAARFRQAFCRQEAQDAAADASPTDEVRELRRWQAVVAETLSDVSDTTAAFGELWLHFALPGNWRLFDDVAETWRELAARGLQLGVASNFDRRLHDVCRGLPPLDGCQRVFVSSELGARKPSSNFFRRVQDRLQLAAKQIMLVGDDWDNDFLAARQAGWRALFLDRRGRRGCGAETVRSLHELAGHGEPPACGYPA
jgi:putative hydrolase of the HAD superfamily